jgi:AcrR family transcriptional regulator
MTVAARLFREGGQPSVEEIARAADVSRTTFYRSFPSRAALVRSLALEPEPSAQERVLQAAMRSLQSESLSSLSMDELAERAGISRANLYRLFPGKPALFRAILVAYSPFEPVMALLSASAGRPPEELIPELVLTAYSAVRGHSGLLRTILFEVTSMTPDTQQAFRETGLLAFQTLGRYLATQMAAGRLRRMHPMLAVQALVGPIMLHLLGGTLLSATAPEVPSGDAAVRELATVWLQGMRP